MLDEEEQRVLGLLPLLDHAPEHLLVHQVRMYVLRYAVPAVEIEFGGLAKLDVPAVRRRLWSCMFGRALDDLVDGDSRFFTPSASCVLLLHYARLLGSEGAWVADGSVFAATRVVPQGSGEAGEPDFARIRADVGARVTYFLDPADEHGADAQAALADYVGVLLGATDLVDAVADSGRSSTFLSRALRRELEDDEGKVLLDTALFDWHARMAGELARAAHEVTATLVRRGAHFAARVMDRQRQDLLAMAARGDAGESA